MDRSIRRWVVALGFAGAMSTPPTQAKELCGGVDYPFPYTDVSAVGAAFCPGIMEAYVTGVSKGTTPTTFNPNETVTRVQMTTFLQRSLDQGLTRANRRAALNQWWMPQTLAAMQTIAISGVPSFCAADGENIWISTYLGDEIVQVEASTGKVLGIWTGAYGTEGILTAGGKVFAANSIAEPGVLYMLDPTLPGVVTTAATGLGDDPYGVAFDGTNLWTANQNGSVSIIMLQGSTPYSVTTVTTGFSSLHGILYDGANIWVTDRNAGTLLKLDAAGGIVQSVTVGAGPEIPGFDGTNIWVPNFNSNSITVVQAGSGTVVATIAADASNQFNNPVAASFDGERIMIANGSGGTVTLFKAADLSFMANVPTGEGTNPNGVCSDGINFWVPVLGRYLLRF